MYTGVYLELGLSFIFISDPYQCKLLMALSIQINTV